MGRVECTACGPETAATSEAICEGCAEAIGIDPTPTPERVVIVPWSNPLADEVEEPCPDTLPDFGYCAALAREQRIEELIDEDTDTSSPDSIDDYELESDRMYDDDDLGAMR